MANKQEALEIALKYFGGDELAAKVWVDKYALQENGSFVETSPHQMHERMAKEFARIEEKFTVSESDQLSEYGKEREVLNYDRILELFANFKYLVPQGSVMANLGNQKVLASLSNCVVVPEIHDSYGGIFHTDQQLAQLYKRRCGVGIDISSLRPAMEPVSNAAGSTSGAVSFMHRFSETTREVAQHGRRGALMITMDVRHPDIIDFLNAKKDLTKVTGANISVRLSNEFMQAVEKDKQFKLQWPVDSDLPVKEKTVQAKEIWDLIVQNAHDTAEPGVLFWDQQHAYSTSSVYPGFENLSTNPCSEIAMQGGDSCRLMAVNLFSFVREPFTQNAHFDFDLFFKVCYEGQRLMDDLVELELESIQRILDKVGQDPEPKHIKQNEKAIWDLLYKNGKQGRRTGLGFTGLADALAAMNIKYGNEASLLKIDAIMRVKLMAEWESSIDMAVERGAFESFDPRIERQSEFVKMLSVEFPLIYERMMKLGRRNISISTVAPTGSLSLLTQTSSGIEPVYLLSYKRRRKVDEKAKQVDFIDQSGDHWEEFEVLHPKLSWWQKVVGNQSIDSSPYFNATAKEIDWKTRVEIQAIVQKYTTHSISSTINLPSDASVDLISQIYKTAWRRKLKGITVYREGSRDGVLLDKNQRVDGQKIKRPEILPADVIRFNNEGEQWIAVVGLMDNAPYEVFTGKIGSDFPLPEWVKNGWVIKVAGAYDKRYDFQFKEASGETNTIEGLSRAFNKEYWNYAKLISGILRHGMPLMEVVKLVGSLNLYDEIINTWKNGVTRSLAKYIEDGTQSDAECPSCKMKDVLMYQEGCLKCSNCGFSECN